METPVLDYLPTLGAKIWRPHEKQEEFLSLPDSIFEGFYGGAAGGGKSELLVMLPIARGLYKIPQFRGLLLRRTFPELQKSLIARSKVCYPLTGAKYNEQLKRWTWPSGAVLEFGYSQDERDIRQYDTDEYSYIGLDELTHFTEFQYLYITSRCRSTTPGLPKIVRSASNPGNIGHGWVRKRFVEPCRTGGSIILDQRTGTKRIFISARLTDNPFLEKEDPEYANRLLILPLAERKAKLEGDWWTFTGQVFDEWRYERFPDEPENALHVIPPFPIPDWWPKILAVDWGFSAMCWAGWAAVSPDARCFLYREYATRRTKISTWATDLKNISEGENIRSVVLDPSAWSKRGDEQTIQEQFTMHSGFNPKRADNDRIGGKILMQEFIRWAPKPLANFREQVFSEEIAAKVLRMNGLEAYKNYLKSFDPPKPETNLPRLQVFENCREFAKAIPLCVYIDPTRDSGGDPEDVADFEGDDPYDGGRYLIKEVDRFCRESSEEYKRLQATEAVLKKFEASKNVTGYYRDMEALERATKTVRGISRYHSAKENKHGKPLGWANRTFRGRLL